jgi:hypothetical protein
MRKVTSQIALRPNFLLLCDSVPAALEAPPVEHDTPNADGFFCQCEFGPAIGMPLVVAFRAHVRIRATLVPEPKPIVDVNLCETRIAS